MRPTPLVPGSGALARRSVLVGLLGLTACGGSGASTRTADTAKGPVKVPVSPKRVVAASPNVASYMWDAGVDPVGVYELDRPELLLPSHHLAKFQRTPKVKVPGELDVQPRKVAALRPDLIIGFDGMTGIEDTTYAELAKIAPTAMLRMRGSVDSAHEVAGLLGRTTELSRLESSARAAYNRIRTTYAGALAGRRFARVKLDADGKGSLDVFSGIEEILAGVSFTLDPPPNGTPPTSPPEGLTYRQVAGRLTNADAIVSTPLTALPVTKAFARPDFRHLKAVREGHLLHVPATYLCVSQILANLNLLEGLLRKM